MNKAELKAKWGKYTDTDKLVDDIMTLLTKYRHRNSEHGVCVMLDTYFTNKAPLIELFQKSEHYAGNMRIVMEKEFERDNSASEVRYFCMEFDRKLHIKDAILKTKDESGKTMADYLKTGVRNFDVSRLKDVEFTGRLKTTKGNLGKFTCSGYTRTSSEIYDAFSHILYVFRDITSSTMSSRDIERIQRCNASIKLAAGMKTSRAFNRVCDTYGVSALSGYNKLFATYSDMVSGLVRKLDYVISVNPYDYLTMSFGKSWASCHTIDKTNIRNMPNSYSGMYCGGCLSYMLDGTSIITFVVDKGDDVQQAGKIYRNMFHYGNNILVQSRIYPQGNDGSTDLYKKFRTFMQDEMAVLMGLENNMWTIKNGTGECSSRIRSHGRHYRDYNSFSSCNVCYPSERKDNIANIDVGHDGICPYCGRAHGMESQLSHGDCRVPSDRPSIERVLFEF